MQPSCDPGHHNGPERANADAITREGGDVAPDGPYLRSDDPGNPHIKYYESDRRCYFRASLTPTHVRFDLRFVTSADNQSGTGYTARSWVVETSWQ